MNIQHIFQCKVRCTSLRCVSSGHRLQQHSGQLLIQLLHRRHMESLTFRKMDFSGAELNFSNSTKAATEAMGVSEKASSLASLLCWHRSSFTVEHRRPNQIKVSVAETCSLFNFRKAAGKPEHINIGRKLLIQFIFGICFLMGGSGRITSSVLGQ